MSSNLSQYQISNIVQGEFAVSDDPNIMMTTILGSCVAVCLYDPEINVGGMNHFLLPGFCDSLSGTNSCGLNMMELLINGLHKKGAIRSRLQGKIFGGANMKEGLSDIGAENAKFARNFLRYEGITNLGESLGGNYARRIRFWPTTGKAQQLELRKSETVQIPQPAKSAVRPSSDIEFF